MKEIILGACAVSYLQLLLTFLSTCDCSLLNMHTIVCLCMCAWSKKKKFKCGKCFFYETAHAELASTAGVGFYKRDEINKHYLSKYSLFIILSRLHEVTFRTAIDLVYSKNVFNKEENMKLSDLIEYKYENICINIVLIKQCS